MDLIYTDVNRQELGVLKNYTFDLAYGYDENNFECKVDIDDNVCAPGSLIYIDGTEYGGIIDSVKIDTKNSEITYSGRTFHGMLNSHVPTPAAGDDYIVLNGPVNAAMGQLLAAVGIDDIFEASTAQSGSLNNFKWPRYVGLYDGLLKMLRQRGSKLEIRVSGGKVVLQGRTARTYANDIDSDLVEFDISKNYNPVNHVICLGGGQLKDRLVKHLYADADGNVSQTQTLFGSEEVTVVYDYPNAESEDELLEGGTEIIQESRSKDAIRCVFSGTDASYDILDKQTATENVTGIKVTATITKKIVSIQNGDVNVSYEIGG